MGVLFLPSASCGGGGDFLWTSAFQRHPRHGLAQSPVLLTLTSGWPRGSVTEVEERRRTCWHLPSVLTLGAATLEVGAEEEARGCLVSCREASSFRAFQAPEIVEGRRRDRVRSGVPASLQ